MEQDKPLVLVVEDEKALSDVIQTKLETSGMRVITATTSQQALDHLTQNEVDAIWLDHYLPGRDSGLTLVAKLKEEGSKWAAIPVFVVSNTASADKVEAYLKFGVNKYYAKAEHRLDEIVSDIQKLFTTKEAA